MSDKSYVVLEAKEIRLIQAEKTIKIQHYNNLIMRKLGLNKNIIIIEEIVEELNNYELKDCTMEIDFNASSVDGVKSSITKTFFGMNLVKTGFVIGCEAIGAFYYVFSNFPYEEVENEVRWIEDETLRDKVYYYLNAEKEELIRKLKRVRAKNNYEEYTNILKSLQEINKCIYMNFES